MVPIQHVGGGGLSLEVIQENWSYKLLFCTFGSEHPLFLGLCSEVKLPRLCKSFED